MDQTAGQPHRHWLLALNATTWTTMNNQCGTSSTGQKGTDWQTGWHEILSDLGITFT